MICNIDNLKIMFDKMKEEGWDIHSNLKWGSFLLTQIKTG